MKGCSLFNAKYYLCNRNSERSLVIQNNELSRISLISKSLPIQPVFNRRVLCFKHLAQYHIFLSDSCIVCCVNLNTDVCTEIYKDDILKINYMSLASEDRLLLFCYEDVIGSFAYLTYIKILNLKTKEIEYFRKLTPENAGMRINSIPAIGFEKKGILYTNLDIYTAAIDISLDRLLWERKEDYWAYNAKDMFEYKGVLLKCGINATTGYNAKTGEILYNYDNYGSNYATQQGQYVYLLTCKGFIDIIDIKSGTKLDYIKCKYDEKGESFLGSYPTLIDGKMYIMSYNHLFRYPTYPW